MKALVRRGMNHVELKEFVSPKFHTHTFTIYEIHKSSQVQLVLRALELALLMFCVC